ncbi:hypothetical protein ACH4VS_20120 [Streptomyces hygroscopicus]|uniref:hypothetical protein n=1 Tax=Streptomyces hygroscopicus TaxID=1912 RepID=UPI001180EBC2|nr:hypothetical protein [Streptomyces hygroscopicus]
MKEITDGQLVLGALARGGQICDVFPEIRTALITSVGIGEILEEFLTAARAGPLVPIMTGD